MGVILLSGPFNFGLISTFTSKVAGFGLLLLVPSKAIVLVFQTLALLLLGFFMRSMSPNPSSGFDLGVASPSECSSCSSSIESSFLHWMALELSSLLPSPSSPSSRLKLLLTIWNFGRGLGFVSDLCFVMVFTIVIFFLKRCFSVSVLSSLSGCSPFKLSCLGALTVAQESKRLILSLLCFLCRSPSWSNTCFQMPASNLTVRGSRSFP